MLRMTTARATGAVAWGVFMGSPGTRGWRYAVRWFGTEGRGTEATADSGYQTVTATAPTAELTRYAVDLRALTGGRGSFTATYDRYDAVPDHLMASIPTLGS